MSQGTTIIIQAENTKGEKHNFFYGTTWGIGRFMPSVFIRLVNLSEVIQYDRWPWLTNKYFEKFKMTLYHDGLNNIVEDYKEDIEDKEFLDRLDKAPLSNLKEIQNFIGEYIPCAEFAENGAMVIWAKQKPNLQTEFSFCLLDRDYNPIKYKDWVKEEHQEDCNESFNALFYAFCEHFQIKEIDIN